MPRKLCWFAVPFAFAVPGCTLPFLDNNAAGESCTDETQPLTADATFESKATGEVIELGSYLDAATAPFVGTYAGSLTWDQLGTTTELTLSVERDPDQSVTLYYCGQPDGVEVPANVHLGSSDGRLDLGFSGELAIDGSGSLLPAFGSVRLPFDALPLDQIGVPSTMIDDRWWYLSARLDVRSAGDPPFSGVAISMIPSADPRLESVSLATGTLASHP
jgi:hypothetical protein